MARPSRLVGIDTQILIFAHREKHADSQQEQLSLRSRRLLQELQKEECQLVISMITVAEYIAGEPQEKRAQVGQQLMEWYQIAPFNLRAAVIAAGLTPLIKSMVNADRQILSADAKIVSSIVAFPCTEFYTYDTQSKLAKIAASLIQVKGLPPQLEISYEETNPASDETNPSSDETKLSKKGRKRS